MKKSLNLPKKAFQLRQDVLNMCVRAGTGHVTSSLSCVDILAVLFCRGILRFDPQNPSWPNRDRFILSKGQASPALYAILADLGYFPKDDLDLFAQECGKFGVHLQQNVPGAEITSGSLGIGLGIAAGIALAAKMDGKSYRVYCLIGDGEMHEGSIWETAMFAAHHKMDNLTVIIDRNSLCVTGRTEEIVALEPLHLKWEGFGWHVQECDGHNFNDLLDKIGRISNNKPMIVIARTIKGKGIPGLENQVLWHGMAPTGEMAEQCRKELQESYMRKEAK
tara:strand:+ start:1669 stop:2502 length:834 start_codon:yes stop_codon:yes gene_type:complete